MGKIIRNGVEYGDVSASNISFTPTSGGGLLSDNVQDALEEINGKIPAAQVNSDWNSSSGVSQILNKPTIPTIPSNVSYFTNDSGYITSAGSCAASTKTSMLDGFANGGAGGIAWGNQTGTGIWYNNESDGGSFGFRKNNPGAGQLSMVIDGTVYVNEGSYEVIHAGNIGSQSVNYANSAGSAGTASTAGSASSAGVLGLGTSGYQSDVINAWYQGNGWQGSPEDWGTFIVSNTGNGTWYSQALLLPWHNNNIMYGRMQGGVFQGWANIITNDNITSFEHNDHAIQTDAGVSWNVNLFGSFAGTSDTTQRTEGFYKSARFIYNPYYCALYLRSTSDAMIVCNARQNLEFAASSEQLYRLYLGVADNMWTLSPSYDGQLQLGTTGRRWGQIFSTNAAINTSDRKEKKDIKELDEFARTLIMSLKPCSYKFINGKSGRTHYGMIAQDIEESLDKLGITAMDLAAFCKDSKYAEEVVDKDTENEHVECTPIEGEYTYGLRYEEFIAPMIKTIQLQQNQIDKQQEEIDLLKELLKVGD